MLTPMYWLKPPLLNFKESLHILNTCGKPCQTILIYGVFSGSFWDKLDWHFHEIMVAEKNDFFSYV